jgi:hypothetical protein
MFAYSSIMRRDLRLTACGLAAALSLAAVSGCATWDLAGAMAWSSSEAKPQTPSKITDIWTDTIFNQPGQTGVRGFGGRVMFCGEDGVKPVAVDGTFTIMAFDDTDGKAGQASPEKKYVFLPEQLPKHYSKSEMGHSYSFWLPWDDVGGKQRKICLVCRFEPRKGKAIVSPPSHHTLPGEVPEEAKKTANPPDVARAGAPAGRPSVEQASYQSQTPDAQPREGIATLTLDVPPSFARPGVPATAAPRAGAVMPGSAGGSLQSPHSTSQRLADSSAYSGSSRTEDRAGGSSAGASLSARSAPSRFPAQRGQTAPPRIDPVRRQPLPATWQSRLPPTPRSGWSAGTPTTNGADEPGTPPTPSQPSE